MEEEKIIQLIIGQLSPEEKKEVLKGIYDSPKQRETYYRLKNAWAFASQHDLTKSASQESINRFLNKIHNQQRKIIRKRLIGFTKYAAAILIAFFAGKYVFTNHETQTENNNTLTEVSVPPGQMAHLKLNDGTEISINSCSKLSYPSQFSGKERKVYLSGEAYFEVKHNENVPFVVVCDHQSIKVLGTKFNVMTYPNDKYSETTLIQGKVEILDTLGHLVTDLNPGQLYNQDNDNNNFTVSNVNTILYTSWKDGYYIFNHESLKNIAERLERIFDVNITFRDQTVLNYKFSGKILKNYPIEQVLQILKLTSPVNYNIKENKDGRKNITIFSNKRAS